MKLAVLVSSALVTALSVGTLGFAQDSATVTQAHAQYGPYLADSFGRAVYLFEADTQGAGGSSAKSACEGECLAAWPPVAASDELVAGEGVSPDMLGSVERGGGTIFLFFLMWFVAVIALIAVIFG